jgi:hypothetical protein|tara:strand:+ start:69 stop:923 length:855 start_codon:yes stop_codon:yes gene_type:complete
MNFKISKLLSFFLISFLFSTHLSADGHKTKFKDIKGFKKQFISMHKKKVNRIIEVKKSDGYPVYEGNTSIQFTVNREDAGCGTGKAQTTQIKCDGKGNRSRQELHLGNMKLKNKEYIYEYAVYFDENYEPLEKGAVVIIGQMHTDNKAKGCHSCCHFWFQDFKYKGERYYSWASKAAYSSEPVVIGKISDLKGKWTHIKFHVLWKLDNTGRFKIYKNDEVIADLKNVKTLADTCTGGYMKMGIYRHRTIGYWNSDWESLQDQRVYLDSIILRKPKKDEKFEKNK